LHETIYFILRHNVTRTPTIANVSLVRRCLRKQLGKFFKRLVFLLILLRNLSHDLPVQAVYYSLTSSVIPFSNVDQLSLFLGTLSFNIIFVNNLTRTATTKALFVHIIN